MSFDRLVVIHESPDWVLWRGAHPTSRARYTIKAARPDATDRARVGTRLVEEYEFLRQFFKEKDAPRYLIRPVQADPAESRILYEDLQGTLGQLIRQEGTLPVDMVANVLTQTAEALRFLHNQKLGHGSVHDHTVLVAPDGMIRLGPFVGYKFDPKAVPPPPDMEARYQAPELLTGSLAACNPTSDLYCLGFLALEMLAGGTFTELFGLPPKATPKPEELLSWHANPRKQLPPLRDALRAVPQALVEIVEALTQKDRDQRGYKTASELLQALKDFKLTSNRGLPALRVPGTTAPAEPDEPDEPEAEPESRPARALIAAPRSIPHPLVLTHRLGGRDVRQEFAGPSSVVIGSGERCDLRVRGANVAERHTLIACQRDGWWVYDLRSEEGTYLNGRLVRQHPLADGDELGVGS